MYLQVTDKLLRKMTMENEEIEGRREGSLLDQGQLSWGSDYIIG